MKQYGGVAQIRYPLSVRELLRVLWTRRLWFDVHVNLYSDADEVSLGGTTVSIGSPKPRAAAD